MEPKALRGKVTKPRGQFLGEVLKIRWHNLGHRETLKPPSSLCHHPMVPIPALLLLLCSTHLPKNSPRTSPGPPAMEHPPLPGFSASWQGEEQHPELLLERRSPALLGIAHQENLLQAGAERQEEGHELGMVPGCASETEKR